ncbi:FadR/GntR family transcriptional regulator [Pelagibius sp.]|uniref:FadR/GntR family transcriptional regulator n=1 Tax=Pelagibius sp. TaxID=1931238 RepID=UPI0026172E3A|nr:FadR/GntR family transcriptional regulator [Pelagibius sp.]
MPLRAIEPQRLYQQVAAQLAELIRQGEWGLGERLPPERDLAGTLGVSRPVVREAMIALELSNIVEIRPGAGTYVASANGLHSLWLQSDLDTGPSPFDLISARRIIEGETAAMAATMAGTAELAGLEEAIAKMERDIQAGTQVISNQEDGDLLFHMRLAAATRNSVMESIVQQLWEGMRRPMFAAISDRAQLPRNAKRAAGEHRVILEQVRAKDPDGARRAMQDHLDRVASLLLSE